MATTMQPEKRARTLTTDRAPDTGVEYTKIEVPKELVEPLKNMIAMLSAKINGSDERDITMINDLLDSDEISHKYRHECDVAIELFKATRSKLFQILEHFTDDTLDMNLPTEKFAKFKETRKLISDWFRLGILTLKREDNPISDRFDIIKHSVYINGSCDNKDLRRKIFDDLGKRKVILEKEARLTSFKLLNKYSNDILAEIDVIDVHDAGLYAKAFRSVLRNNSRSSTSRNWRSRTVSFSSDLDVASSPNTEANTRKNEQRTQSRSPYRSRGNFGPPYRGHDSRRQNFDRNSSSYEQNRGNFNKVYSNSFRRF